MGYQMAGRGAQSVEDEETRLPGFYTLQGWAISRPTDSVTYRYLQQASDAAPTNARAPSLLERANLGFQLSVIRYTVHKPYSSHGRFLTVGTDSLRTPGVQAV